MGKRHIVFYDPLLPALGILAAGRFPSSQSDVSLLPWLDSVHAFGPGPWLGRSALRNLLWTWSWAAFGQPGLRAS